MSEPVFVGLDDHHAFVQVCVLDRTGRVLANRRAPHFPPAGAVCYHPARCEGVPL